MYIASPFRPKSLVPGQSPITKFRSGHCTASVSQHNSGTKILALAQSELLWHRTTPVLERGGGGGGGGGEWVNGVRWRYIRILLPAPLTQAGQKPTTKHLTNIQNYKCKKLSGAAHANAWCKRMGCARDADHPLDNHRVVTMHAAQSVPSAGKASCVFTPVPGIEPGHFKVEGKTFHSL